MTAALVIPGVGEYLTDGRELVQVVEQDGPAIVVEDARTEALWKLGPGDITRWRVVVRADD